MDDLLSLDGRIVVVSGAGGGGIGTTVTRMAAEAKTVTPVAVCDVWDGLEEDYDQTFGGRTTRSFSTKMSTTTCLSLGPAPLPMAIAMSRDAVPAAEPRRRVRTGRRKRRTDARGAR